MTDIKRSEQPVSVYKARGFYRRKQNERGQWVALEEMALIVQCNCFIIPNTPCEYIRTALSLENAETLVYAHLRSVHPDKVEEQAWSETLGRYVIA